MRIKSQKFGSMLSRKQDAAIGALLIHRTVEDAARHVGVSSKTIQRWLKRSEFQAAYSQARKEALSQCMARLQQASSAAVSTLLKVMLDPTAPAGSRVHAADCVLIHATQGVTQWSPDSQSRPMSATFVPSSALELAAEEVKRLNARKDCAGSNPAPEDDPTIQ